MAKKKKAKSKKKAVQAPVAERGSFWPLTGAVLLFVIALFLLLGGFGTGGPLPVGLFSGAYAAFGWAAYLLPFALIYWGVYKFSTEDHKMPLGKMTAMILVLVLSAGFFFTAFATEQLDGSYADGNGGWVGAMIGAGVLAALDKVPASILLFVAIIMAIFWMFSISPSIFMSIGRLFSSKSDKDIDLQDLSTKEGFKVKKYDEPEKPEDTEAQAKPLPRHTTFKNTATKLAPSEQHAALTSASDPDWQLPPIDLLNMHQSKPVPGDVNGNAELIKHSFETFGIDVEMEGANVGPRVTQYTMKPPTGVKLSRITALENNLALDLAATSIRMEAPIPGKSAVGIEVPNKTPATVRVSSLLKDKAFTEGGPLTFVIGRDIAGNAIVADLAKMPHLLVAGQTGSGKSVMMNTILASFMYKNSPADLKLILVDPKHVEMTAYNDIPHLIAPVITEPEQCISALKWAVAEMERRLRAMGAEHASNIIEYNEIKKEAGMPYIVIVIDELNDLMMMAARDVEALIVRLTQKARAAGIHVILATQRPSVNVITGVIKANIPARIAFTVNSQVDSRTIIDGAGAEKLLGMGDMLLMTTERPKAIRIQGALIEKKEVVKIANFVKNQREAEYNLEVISQPVQIGGKGSNVVDMGNGGDADEDMWRDAVQVVIDSRKASTSLLQRKLRIGYGRAARIMETMEEQGIIGQADGSRPREVLVSSMDEVFGNPGSSDDSSDEADNEFVA